MNNFIETWSTQKKLQHKGAWNFSVFLDQSTLRHDLRHIRVQDRRVCTIFYKHIYIYNYLNTADWWISIQNRMKSIKSISRPIEIGLRLTGIWPDSSYELVVRLVWIVTLIGAQICQFRYIIKHLNLSSLVDLVEGVGTSLPYSLLCFKLFTFWTEHR